MLLISFYTPWKHQKTRGFLMFSRSIERDKRHEMGQWIQQRIMTERRGLNFLTTWGLIFLIFTLLTLFRKIMASYRNPSISYTANHMTSFYVMATFIFNPLTMFPTYRNQSGDLLCKSTDFYMMRTVIVI